MKYLLNIIITILSFLIVTIGIHANPPEWESPINMQYNMQVVAFLELPDASYSQNESDLIAAFVGNECRGVASPIMNAEGRIFLTIGSNNSSGEEITFKAYLAETGQLADLNEIFDFEDQLGVGDFNDPFIFTVDVLYPPAVYTIEASSGPNGSITPSGNIEVTHGNNQLFTFNPDEGYEVSEVLVNGELIGSPSSYEFLNVTSDQELLVSFSLIIGYSELVKVKSKLYPNPATTHLHIEINPYSTDMHYRLVDANGSQQLEGLIHNQRQTISLERLSQGTYIFEIYKNQVLVEQHKFLKFD